MGDLRDATLDFIQTPKKNPSLEEAHLWKVLMHNFWAGSNNFRLPAFTGVLRNTGKINQERRPGRVDDSLVFYRNGEGVRQLRPAWNAQNSRDMLDDLRKNYDGGFYKCAPHTHPFIVARPDEHIYIYLFFHFLSILRDVLTFTLAYVQDLFKANRARGINFLLKWTDA